MARERKGTLVWRKKGWCARITVTIAGEPVKQWYPLGTENRAAAKRKLARLVAKLKTEGAIPAPPEGAREETVSEYKPAWVADRYAANIVSARDEESNLDKYVLTEFGNKPLSEVKVAGVIAVIKAAMAKGLSVETIRKIRGAVLRLFESATADEIIPFNPVARVRLRQLGIKKPIKKESCILTDEEFGTLMACAPVDLELKLLGLVARVEGGMRTSDLHRWDWSMIDRVHPCRKCAASRANRKLP